MKLKIIDWIFGILIPLAIVTTVLLYRGTRGPDSVVRDVTIHEIAPDGSGVTIPKHGQHI